MLLDKGTKVTLPRLCDEGTFLNAAKGGYADVVRILMKMGEFDPKRRFNADTMLILVIIKGGEDLLRLWWEMAWIRESLVNITKQHCMLLNSIRIRNWASTG